MKKLQNNKKGFTIIEVLIVLAIAGLIMLIVFLAVPALQRNSRNTQRKDDVAKIQGAVNEWSNNHNGQMPTSVADRAAALSNANLGIYNGAVTWANAWPAGVDAAVISINNRCDTESTIAGQNRSVAVLYRVETGGGTDQQCD